MEEGLSSYYSDDFSREVKPGEIMTAYGKVKKGYEYPLIKFVVISESDIFGAEKKKRKDAGSTREKRYRVSAI